MLEFISIMPCVAWTGGSTMVAVSLLRWTASVSPLAAVAPVAEGPRCGLHWRSPVAGSIERHSTRIEGPLPEAAAWLLQVEYLSEKLLSVGIRVDPETVRSAKDTPSEDAPVPIKPPHVSLPPHSISCSRQ